MIRLLAQTATRDPEWVAAITSEETITYGELLADARAVAGGLLARDIERFAVVEHDAAWVLRLLAGAAASGVEPCQYQPDIGPDQLVDQAAALGHDLVVTRRADLASRMTVLRPEDLLASAPADLPEAGPQPVLIRTTGTTGAPKAARHDWAALARTVRDARPRPGQRWLLAYGPQQFAGLQVLQHVVAIGATLVAPFPRQPRDGLAALLDQGVTHASATPTYWRFLLTEARIQGVVLPPLEQITLGGEASAPDLLDDLKAAFSGARISQIYASTEFGSIASVRDGRPGLAAASLWSASNPEGVLQVRDGELWVRAGTGMSGYAGDVSDTPEEVDGWVATGDLAEVVDDRVIFRGRSSEVINVGGVKVHPLPIEERITALPAVAMARVFGRPNRLTGAIVATEIVLVDGYDAVDEGELRRLVRAAVSDFPPAWHPRSVQVVTTLETRGAKTVRGMAE